MSSIESSRLSSVFDHGERSSLIVTILVLSGVPITCKVEFRSLLPEGLFHVF